MRISKILVGDFETTVYAGQTDTQVWASGLCELYTEDAIIHNCIDDSYEYLMDMQKNVLVYYHNLKFDGSFWINYLFRIGYKNALINDKFVKTKEMMPMDIKYMISSRGQWYYIQFRTPLGYIIELRDSVKLLPYSVAQLGDDFKLKHRKLTMEYVGYRCPKDYIKLDEKEYLKNDLFVPKEAIELMYDEGHKKITIGSCCLAEYKKLYKEMAYHTFRPKWEDTFCDLVKIFYSETETVDDFVRESYKGGWTYVKKDKQGKVLYNGLVLDNNSLYPYVMLSESGCKYPVGKPVIFAEKPTKRMYKDDRYFFVRIKCNFELKDGFLPTIQIKGNFLYNPREYLETNRIYNRVTGHYLNYIDTEDGRNYDIRATLTLTCVDLQLFFDHYNVTDLEWLGGVCFGTWQYDKNDPLSEPLFDMYFAKYRKIKENSTGAVRQNAKLFSNNLGGKFGTSPESSYKICMLDDNDTLRFRTVDENDKDTVFVAIASAMTSYGRNLTIRAAQLNYDRFCYSDTDSLHLVGTLDQVVGIKIDPKKYGYWDLEGEWDRAIFTRSKCYLEELKQKYYNSELDKYNIASAGMGKRPRELLIMSLLGLDKFNEINGREHKFDPPKNGKELEFASVKRDLADFKIGLTIPGNFKLKQVKYGCMLVETDFSIK